MIKISKWSYGEYKSSNYGVNCMAVRIEKLIIFFSYDTVVAFREAGCLSRVVHENIWGSTTGKHLNWLDGGDKKNRVPHDEFEQKLQAVLDKHDLVIDRAKWR